MAPKPFTATYIHDRIHVDLSPKPTFWKMWSPTFDTFAGARMAARPAPQAKRPWAGEPGEGFAGLGTQMPSLPSGNYQRPLYGEIYAMSFSKLAACCAAHSP